MPSIARRFFRDPSREVQVIGITGTNGKTTTAYRVRQILESAIGAEIAACAGPPEAVLATIQSSLRCGTNCGSCLPELRQIIARDSANRGRREEAA